MAELDEQHDGVAFLLLYAVIMQHTAVCTFLESFSPPIIRSSVHINCCTTCLKASVAPESQQDALPVFQAGLKLNQNWRKIVGWLTCVHPRPQLFAVLLFRKL